MQSLRLTVGVGVVMRGGGNYLELANMEIPKFIHNFPYR